LTLVKSCCALTLNWIDAINDVIKQMVKHDIWNIVKLLESVKPISCRYKSIVERDSMGNFEIYKDCLVGKSFTRKKTLITKRLSL